MTHGATARALESVRSAPTILEAMSRTRDLVPAARQDDPAAALAHLRAAVADPADGVVAIGAVHALAAVPHPGAPGALAALLEDPAPHLREHAVWALGACDEPPGLRPRLAAMVASGGFGGVLAEDTLERWDRAGLVVGRSAPAPSAPASREPAPRAPARGLTVAQLYLHADIDGSLQHAGQGDTGGIATLLVHLGDALLAEPGIERVLTLSRGDGLTAPPRLASPGHHYLAVALPGAKRHAAQAWPLRVAARDGIRHLLRAAAPVDVVHLRMADVGSWAAAEVAAELGIPVVLTLAPDPHALIAAREAEGTLTRATFAAADHAEHLVFRVRLLRELVEQAAHVLVFPRPDLERDLLELLAIDLRDRPPRLTVVPEGIDLAPLENAVRDVRGALAGADPPPSTAAALADLDDVLRTLPPARRHLPLAVTVGRLHRVKGMATLVAAWHTDPALWERCNLLVVGGDLEEPNDDEAEQFALIDDAVPRASGPARGLLLAGHRPNATVAVWLAAVRFGRPGLAAPHGVYVSASRKEEFGIAILEAMAVGLVVVAPAAGGPATYVDDGVAGVLADTTSPVALAASVRAALDLAGGPDGDRAAERAHAVVSERFGIGTMAAALARVYEEVAR